jgi:pimeloyl-ACP methyl ester carboxylesterase
MFDLMNQKERDEYDKRFDIDLLSRRLVTITLWIYNHADYKNLDLGYFGSSTGAATALYAASRLDDIIKAIVCRGGKPELVTEHIKDVKCPTLQIVGELDFHTIKMNRKAATKMNCTNQVVVVPGASHLFEEPGKMDQVAKDAVTWFKKYLKVGAMDPSLEYDLPGESYD